MPNSKREGHFRNIAGLSLSPSKPMRLPFNLQNYPHGTGNVYIKVLVMFGYVFHVITIKVFCVTVEDALEKHYNVNELFKLQKNLNSLTSIGKQNFNRSVCW